MTAVVRGWLGFCALGAGLIHLALVIGSSPAVGIPLLVVGSAEVLWGIFAFTAHGVPLPRFARFGALVPILGWVLALVLASGVAEELRPVPMLVASLLDLAIAIGITGMLRIDPTRPVAPLRPGRYLLGLGAGALVVAAITIPAIAITGTGFAETPELILPGQHGSH